MTLKGQGSCRPPGHRGARITAGLLAPPGQGAGAHSGLHAHHPGQRAAAPAAGSHHPHPGRGERRLQLGSHRGGACSGTCSDSGQSLGWEGQGSSLAAEHARPKRNYFSTLALSHIPSMSFYSYGISIRRFSCHTHTPACTHSQGH